MTPASARFAIHRTCVDRLGAHSGFLAGEGLTATAAAAYLHQEAEQGVQNGAVVVQRWDGIQIDHGDGDSDYFDAEPVPYDHPAAAAELLPAALSARWPDSGFQVSAPPDNPGAMRVCWTDGPAIATVAAFTTQVPARAFHRPQAVILDRDHSPAAWMYAIVVVESTYGIRVPRAGAGIDWAGAAALEVAVPLCTIDSSTPADVLHHTAADLLFTHLGTTDFSSLRIPRR